MKAARGTRRVLARVAVKCAQGCKAIPARHVRRHAADTGHALTETRTYRVEKA